MPHFEQAIAASQGARRYQEDAASVWPIPDAPLSLLAVLADGMGGHAGGAKASQLVCEKTIESFRQSTGETPARLTQALSAANDAIARTVDNNPSLSGMGSTIIAAVFGPAGLEWVSVGDSPLYLLRGSKITLLNEDHSLAPALDQMAAEGRITLEAARNDPRRHMLRSAVTGEEFEMVDLSPMPLALEAGDYVILASDGIHTIGENEIARVAASAAADGPQAVADELVKAVLGAGEIHQDNITVIAVRLCPAAAADDAQ
jgi:PPM family protein phosphatase